MRTSGSSPSPDYDVVTPYSRNSEAARARRYSHCHAGRKDSHKRGTCGPNLEYACGHLTLAVLGVLVALLLLLQLLGHSLGKLGIAPFLRLERGLEAVSCEPEERVGLEVVQLVEEDVESVEQEC